MILVETDKVILDYDSTGFTLVVTYDNCSNISQISNAGISVNWISLTSQVSSSTSDMIAITYVFSTDTNTTFDVRSGLLNFSYTDDDSAGFSLDIQVKQGNNEVIELPIWMDTYYTAVTTPFTYSIQYEGIDVYYGKAYSKPSESGPKIQINNICNNYMRMHLGDFRTFDDDVVENNADGYFKLCDVDGVVLMTYHFLMDWSSEWSGQSPYVMTENINGHLDPRMRAMFTVYDSASTVINWVIVNNE